MPPVPLMPCSCPPVPAEQPEAALDKTASEGKDEKGAREKKNRKGKPKEELDFGEFLAKHIGRRTCNSFRKLFGG